MSLDTIMLILSSVVAFYLAVSIVVLRSRRHRAERLEDQILPGHCTSCGTDHDDLVNHQLLHHRKDVWWETDNPFRR
jgi:hypothetical protein